MRTTCRRKLVLKESVFNDNILYRDSTNDSVYSGYKGKIGHKIYTQRL